MFDHLIGENNYVVLFMCFFYCYVFPYVVFIFRKKKYFYFLAKLLIFHISYDVLLFYEDK